jgi:hypothetical protein
VEQSNQRVKNWSQILPYLISFRREASRRVQEDIFNRVEKPHRLAHLEAAFQPIDVSVVRASLFELVAKRRVVAPDIDSVPFGVEHAIQTIAVMRRPNASAGYCRLAKYRQHGAGKTS